MRPIDADALRERLQNLAYDDWNQGITTSFADACHEIIDIIEEQPTIEPRKGIWTNGKCSNCGEHAPFWAMATTYYESNYCPNCGARMERRTG